MKTSKSTLKNGDRQLPTQNARKHNDHAGSHDEPKGDVARGYTGGEKIGKQGKG